MNQGTIREAFLSTAKNFQSMAENKGLIESLEKSVAVVVDAYKKGGCLLVCGNGGSAADSQHIVAELVSKLNRDRDPIKAIALTVDTSILTAIGNDYGYEWSFHRQVRALMGKNDVLLAITTSGNSPNILRALEATRQIGGKSILLSGRTGGAAAKMADHVILGAGDNTAAIQECHLGIYHLFCYLLETQLIQAGLCKYVDAPTR